MFIRETTTGCEVWTPAKLNLTLDLLSQRADGYHEIDTWIDAISIYDTLQIRPSQSPQLRMTVDWAVGRRNVPIPTDNDNLVLRALEMLRRHTSSRQGAEVRLIKRIPTQAGMGGGSSDAAAALLGGCHIWNCQLPTAELCRLGAEVGSDVPFFLGSSPARCRGRGEWVERVKSAGTRHYVVVHPPVGLSTPEVYQAYRERNWQTPPKINSANGNVPQGRDELGKWLRNDLQAAATRLTDWCDRLACVFSRLGLVGHQMTGSGTAYFGICHHARQTRQAAARFDL